MTATTTMQALVFETAGQLRLESRPLPTLSHPDDVMVRVAAVGICGTDRSIVLGDFPARSGVVLGHEAVGEVVATGPAVTSLAPGGRVVINPTYHCGGCGRCRRGMAAHCTSKDGRELGVDCDGTLAEYVVVPAPFLHPLPPEVSYARAALVEPLACVLNNLTAASLRWTDRCLVIGAGPIGTLCALVLACRGHHVTVVERDTVRVELARRILPAAARVLPEPDGGLWPAAEGTDSGPEVVVDTTGALPADALQVVAAGGTVVAMGERETATATIPVRSLVTRGVRLVGAGPYPPHLFQTALDLAGDLPLETLVTHALPLHRYADAFTALHVPLAATRPETASYAAMKVLLLPGDQAVEDYRCAG
ncbi:zinc-binding dehydrogenase [Streptomyces sp. NPDC048516]|uniref:zinc-dependent alcohol dehydrogenase n=1 Tax=Streptomyces sp. NPDC048516 TaxID=3365565 RepID=UPI003721D48B